MMALPCPALGQACPALKLASSTVMPCIVIPHPIREASLYTSLERGKDDQDLTLICSVQILERPLCGVAVQPICNAVANGNIGGNPAQGLELGPDGPHAHPERGWSGF